MGIDKIGPINSYNNFNKVNKKNQTDKTKSSDSVNISKEALNKAETSKVLEIVNQAPDIRIDKINAVKEKLKDPDYLDQAIADTLADKIMKALDI